LNGKEKVLKGFEFYWTLGSALLLSLDAGGTSVWKTWNSQRIEKLSEKVEKNDAVGENLCVAFL